MTEQHDVATLVEPLIELLYSHMAAHRELAELLEEKEQAILKLKLESLDELMERERALINRISALEERRLELTCCIGELLDYDEPSSIRLSAIVPYVSMEVGDALVEIRDELRAVASRIDKVQQRNRTLVSTSLDHIHLFLSVLSGAESDAKSYSPKGETESTARPAVLDRRF